ncbi:MAG: ATP-dependent sacrificial sulfur transferase LarE [Desulfobacteraceae bacterium]|nr:ATP-dependent sacrificial sulfur transferase LarE [Desulfobacteraceae bacterium]
MTSMNSLQEKKEQLFGRLAEFRSLAVAYSGGVDSTLLLAAARDAVSDNVLAVTAVSPLQPRWEVDEAVKLAGTLGVAHEIIRTDELSVPDFTANSPDRCYFCKKIIFSHMFTRCRELGFPYVAHGANVDDMGDYRPGMKAAEEMQVLSPLREAGFSKEDIRSLSRQMGLSNWNKPAAACLASRIPYGTEITKQRLEMVEAAENVLLAMGFSGFRVRHHGDTARIEVRPADFARLIKPEPRLRIIQELRGAGFTYVTLDLEGYAAGRMNRSIGF